MSNPVTPATDEEVEAARRYGPGGKHDIVDALIARIDAERAARERAEAVRDRMRALLDAIAVAVRGPPASNALHDHARLPDEVAKIKAARDKWEARTVRLADALWTEHDTTHAMHRPPCAACDALAAHDAMEER